jgi:acetylornithine deacetylase/succinyl-diaminopimelate desuccinylase family protein
VHDRHWQNVSNTIEQALPAMQTLLAKLVAIPSENPPGSAYDACVQSLEESARDLRLPTERVPCGGVPERTAVKVSIGNDGPALVFHGHYDVVPAASRDQFVPRIEGDVLFGRGSSDMKGGIVAMLHAAHALAASGLPTRGRLHLLFVPDEETGGAAATGALAASGRIDRHAIGMVIGEPTSGRVWHSSRGALTLAITVRGRAAHVGLQHHGINAVERALPLLERLFERKRDLDRRGSVLLVGGRVDAGTSFNLVPDACRFTLDRRINPDEDFDEEKRSLLRLLEEAKAAGTDLTVEVIQNGRSSSTPAEHPFGRTLAGAIEQVCGAAPVFEMCPGLLETRFYAEYGVPSFAYGPGILAVSHGPHEFVKLSAVAACARVYALTALRALS